MTKIDEQTLKDAVARGIPRTGGYVPPSYMPPTDMDIDEDEESEDDEETLHPKRKSKINSAIDEYRKSYLFKIDVPARQLIYVSEEVHESLMDIVKVIGGKKATMGSYVENILRSHLSEHKELINRVHKSKYKSPVKW